jgi:hypothetical protein
METKYSFTKGLTKLLQFIVVALPMVLSLVPSEIGNMTISSVLFLTVNWLKVSYLKK